MLPSPLTILAAVVVAFFVVLTVARGPVDADYWWHLTTGRLILERGSVPTIDPYSFAYDGPWVAHEWLGEVIIAALVDAVGFPVTAALFGLAAAGAIILPAAALHRRGTRLAAIVPWVAVAAYTLASYATVRPQVLSWLLLAILLALLMTVDARDRLRPWLVVPLMLVWANVHGLYVVGLGVIGGYALFTLIGRTPMAARHLTTIGMFVAAIVASAVTPAGPAGLVYPLRYLRQDDWGTAFIAEWQAADFTDPRQWGVAVFIIGTVLLVRRLRPDWLTVTGVLGLVGALIAVRNAPIAVVAGLPMLAMALESWLRARGSVRTQGTTVAKGRRLVELAVAAVVIIGIVVIIPGAAAGTETETFPTAAFDRLEERDPDARLLVEYNWAGYAIHRLQPSGGQVFIDGRSDMYPREVFEDYQGMREAGDGWERLVDEYAVEAMLLPTSAPLIGVAEEAGWCAAHEDASAALLLPCGTF